MGDSKTNLGLAPTRVQSEGDISLEATISLAEGEQPRSTHAFPEGKILADRYRVIRPLGRGGMAEVYLGEHTTIGKQVAIKVAGVAFANESELRQRFLQEARAASVIHHPNIVDITDFGHTPEGVPFFTMEYLQGEDLAATLKREGRFAWPRAKAVVLQILDALKAAHEKGIVHRDMKPQNCFRLSRGAGGEDFIKVVDFGLAKVVSKHMDQVDMTRSGVVMGTATYMPPEQAMGLEIDHRADIYSVGVMLFEMLVGHPPFRGGGFLGVLHLHINEPVPSLRKQVPEISRAVEDLVFRALAKRREHRFQTVEEFAAAVAKIPDDPLDELLPAPPRNRLVWALTLLAVAGVAAAVTVVLLGQDADTNTPADAQIVAGNILAPEAGPERAVASGSTGGEQSPTFDEARTSAGEAPSSTDSEQLGGTSAPVGETDATTTEGTGQQPTATDGAMAQATTAGGATTEDKPKPDKTKSVPRRLSDRAIKQTLKRAQTKLSKRCQGTFGSETVQVSFSILPSGKLEDVRVAQKNLAPNFRRCIVAEVSKIRFPAAKEGRKSAHVFQL